MLIVTNGTVAVAALERAGMPGSLNLNMDGLAAPQGRAFDVALKVRYDLSKNWTLWAGYRMLEGGADTDEVYTFAWLHYAAVSINFRF